MSITCEYVADSILSTVAKLFVTSDQRQYLFATLCIWWIAALVQLDPALRYFLGHQKFPSEKIKTGSLGQNETTGVDRGICSTHRNIQ